MKNNFFTYAFLLALLFCFILDNSVNASKSRNKNHLLKMNHNNRTKHNQSNNSTKHRKRNEAEDVDKIPEKAFHNKKRMSDQD